MDEFSSLLKRAREKKHLTKSQVASLFGWTPMYYGRYENGKLNPTKTNYEKFAKFIGISVTELEKILNNK